MISFDYETHLITKEHPYPKPVCVSSFNGWNKKILVGADIEPHISYILDTQSVAHNATFELGVTWVWYPALRPKIRKALIEGRIFCTQIMQGVLNSRIENMGSKLKPASFYKRYPLLTPKGPYKLDKNNKAELHQFMTYHPEMRPKLQPAGLSLASLVSHYFGDDMSEVKKGPDAWRLRYSELEGLSLDQWPQAAIDYSIQDSVYTHRLYSEIQKTSGLSLNKANSRLIEASFWLNLMGKKGIEIDQSRVLQLEAEIYEKLAPKYDFLIETGFCTPTKQQRPKKNMKVLCEHVKNTVKNPIKSPKGNIKTDLEALTSYYVDTQDRVFSTFLDLNEYDKVLTAYVSRLKGADLIMSDYRMPMTTGRTSSAGSSLYPSVNIQQMPRKVPNVTWDVRNCFVPRAGYTMVSIDYSGLELASAACQLAKTFGKSQMRDMLNAGDTPVDLHSMLAAQIMTLKGQKTTYETFIGLKKTEPYAGMRQLCKAINLGFPGGIGYDVMRQQLLAGGTKTKFTTLLASEDKAYLLAQCWNLLKKDQNIRVKQIAPREWALVYDELVGLKKDMFKVYPDLERFLKEQHKGAMTGEILHKKNKFGEWEDEPMYRYQVGDFVQDWCTYTSYCNGYLMQTPASIGAINAGIELGRQYSEHLDVNILAFIHDEYLFEVRIGKEAEHIRNVSEIMLNEMQKVLKGVRLAVEATKMPYWTKEGGESIVYYKDANSLELRWK